MDPMWESGGLDIHEACFRVVSQAQYQIGAAPQKAENRNKIGANSRGGEVKNTPNNRQKKAKNSLHRPPNNYFLLHLVARIFQKMQKKISIFVLK